MGNFVIFWYWSDGWGIVYFDFVVGFFSVFILVICYDVCFFYCLSGVNVDVVCIGFDGWWWLILKCSVFVDVDGRCLNWVRSEFFN